MDSPKLDIDAIKKRLLIKYPYFGSVINKVKYQVANDSVPTAGTDGKTIYFNEQFMQSLTNDEQIFIFAHEVCHIAFNHILRSKDRDGYLWNIATDAVINQQLKKDNLPFVEGGVDFEDAINYNAEQYYNKLLEEEKKKQEEQKINQSNDSNQNNQQQSQGGQSNSNQSGSQQNQNNNQQQNQNGGNQSADQNQNDDNKNKNYPSHDMWKKAVEEAEKQAEKEKNEKSANADNKSSKQKDDADKKQPNKEQSSSGANQDQQAKDGKDKKQGESENIDEKKEFDKNRQERKALAKRIKEQLQENIRNNGDGGNAGIDEALGPVGSASKAVYNWKRRLKKELEIEDERWGRKFSSKDNNYAMRIEDYEYDEQAETEIILDVSGSVSEELLRAFLRQVKTILKNSKIKVGFFADDFSGFQEIKTEKDIDNLRISIYGGTNFDVASKSFSKDKNINKICFTDGQDGGDAGIVNPRKDIIWVSFQNPHFHPDNGKVIFVDPQDIMDFKKKTKLEDDEQLTM